MAGATGLEPATFGVTGRHSNQLSYTRIPLYLHRDSVAAINRRGALSSSPGEGVSTCKTEKMVTPEPNHWITL